MEPKARRSLVKFFPFITSIAIFFVLSLINYLAVRSYLYWKIYWLDMVMHSLGGLALGLLFFSLLFYLKENNKLFSPKYFIFLSVVSFAVFGGVMWEMFEYVIREFFSPLIDLRRNLVFGEIGYQDTISDLGFDFLGGLFAGLFSVLYIRYNESHARKRNIGENDASGLES